MNGIEDDQFEPLGLPEAPDGWVFTNANLPGDQDTVDIGWTSAPRTNDRGAGGASTVTVLCGDGECGGLA
ncbi:MULTISPECIES: hypothetical protein [unclassified Nonomuraea]|uniref:hypothetical protein n=1 Tax=unclassified Nonomuraea TaxID=2593643 RepID=UPI0033C1979F